MKTARLAFAAAALCAAAFAQESPFQNFQVNAHERVLHFKINEERSRRGLGQLAFAPDAATLARYYSLVMARKGDISHEDETGFGPGDRLARMGVAFSAYAENLAFHRSASEAHAGLMGSYRHAMNILTPEFTEVGVGVVEDSGGNIYVTEIFLRRFPAAGAGEAEEEIWRQIQSLRREAGVPELLRDHDASRKLAEARRAAPDSGPLQVQPSEPVRILASVQFSGPSPDFPASYGSLARDPRFTHGALSAALVEHEKHLRAYAADVLFYGTAAPPAPSR